MRTILVGWRMVRWRNGQKPRPGSLRTDLVHEQLIQVSQRRGYVWGKSSFRPFAERSLSGGGLDKLSVALGERKANHADPLNVQAREGSR